MSRSVYEIVNLDLAAEASVSGVSVFRTGWSGNFGGVAVSECGNFFVCIVLFATGTGVIFIPADFSAACRFSLVIYEVMAQFIGGFALIAMSAFVTNVHCVTVSFAGSRSYYCGVAVTGRGNFFICRVITIRARFISFVTCQCAGGSFCRMSYYAVAESR